MSERPIVMTGPLAKTNMKTWQKTDLPLFDAVAANQAKERGISQAEGNKKSLVAFARKVAEEVAERKGVVNMDDVAFELSRREVSIFALGNSAAAVFSERTKWEWTGTFAKSARVHSHGNLIRNWRRKK